MTYQADHQHTIKSGFYDGLRFWKPLIQNHVLVSGLARRQISAKYRGSMFGMFWAVLTPLIMLGVYTFVFTVIFDRGWKDQLEGKTNYALFLYMGLVCHQFLSECINRGPNLIHENKTYVKRIIFPLDALPWVFTATACFGLVVNYSILLILSLIIYGLPPITVLLMPLVFIPLIFFGLGIIYLFAAIGVYVRDLRQVSMLLVSLFLFGTPIFYPLQAVPESMRWIFTLNPLATIVTQGREMTFFGNLPQFDLIALVWLQTLVFVVVSSFIFSRLRQSFADVV